MLIRLLALSLALIAPHVAQASARIDIPACPGFAACGAVPGLLQVQDSNEGPGTGQEGLGRSSGLSDRGSGRDPADRPVAATGLPRAASDVVAAPDGSPEYVALVNTAQVGAAIAALRASGVRLARQRSLPQLGQQMLFFSLPRGLDPAQVRAVLQDAVPSALMDLHHIYRRTAGPRVYHGAMLGDAPGQSCQVRGAVRVGVIDGALHPGHPALSGVALTRQSFLSRSERSGAEGHGTAVAAMIAGAPTSGPLAGLAPGVQLFAAEAFGKARRGPGGRLESVTAALDWMMANRVRLVNMSFAGESNLVFDRVLGIAQSRDVVMVAAAGNDGSGVPVYPAASSATIAVTAVDAAGAVYGRANYGPHIEFAAPGVDLYVASGASGGSYRSGTSFATPVVTALLARRAARGGLSLKAARGYLREGARDLGPGGRDTRFGYGLVQSGGC